MRKKIGPTNAKSGDKYESDERTGSAFDSPLRSCTKNLYANHGDLKATNRALVSARDRVHPRRAKKAPCVSRTKPAAGNWADSCYRPTQAALL